MIVVKITHDLNVLYELNSQGTNTIRARNRDFFTYKSIRQPKITFVKMIVIIHIYIYIYIYIYVYIYIYIYVYIYICMITIIFTKVIFG